MNMYIDSIEYMEYLYKKFTSPHFTSPVKLSRYQLISWERAREFAKVDRYVDM